MKKHTKRKTALSVFLAILAVSVTVLTVLFCKSAADKNADPITAEPQITAVYDSTALANAPDGIGLTEIADIPEIADSTAVYDSTTLANAQGGMGLTEIANIPEIADSTAETKTQNGQSGSINAESPEDATAPEDTESTHGENNSEKAKNPESATGTNTPESENNSREADTPESEITPNEPDTAPNETGNSPDGVTAPNGTNDVGAPNGTTVPNGTNDVGAPNGTTTPDNTNSGKSNVFEEIYEWFERYLGDIFSALAFAVGLAAALIYKKGLVPLIARIGSAIKGSVDTAVEAGERLIEDTAKADLKLDGLTERLNGLHSELELMKNQLDLAGALEERAKIQNVLLMEIDLLYTVFTSSSLPEYMKDELDRRVGAMRRELSQNE